ncbi:MAG: hypothetical protein JNL58_29200 [Planctomyces sp.]|nr:hypothetical protein [Planctomyces sp.]
MTTSSTDAAESSTQHGVQSNSFERMAMVLNPMGPLQFRDGRPLEGGFLHRGLLPTPQTLTGALRFALLQYFGNSIKGLDNHIKSVCAKELSSEAAFREAVRTCFEQHEWIASVRARGPWLMQQFPNSSGRDDEVLLPLPTGIQHSERTGRWSLLEPLDTAFTKVLCSKSGGQGLHPLWSLQPEPSEFVDRYLRPEGVQWYLSRRQNITTFADVANRRDQQSWFVPQCELFTEVPSVGIDRNLDTSSVVEGRIFAPCQLAFPGGTNENGRPCPRTVFYVELDVPSEAKDKVDQFMQEVGCIGFGGRGGEVQVEATGLFDLLQPKVPASDRLLLLATSPVLAKDFSRPDALETVLTTGKVKLVSASIPRSFPVSGWDAARRCPQPTRFAAAAGSVYYVELDGTEDEKTTARNEIVKLPSLSPEPYAAHGWGTFIVGTWEYIRLGNSHGRTQSGIGAMK